MSTISDGLRDAKRAEMLVELDFGGLVKRYAMRDLVVPYASGTDKFFEGAILRPFEVSTRFDFTNFAYSYQSVVIDIANKGRLQDQEARQKLDGGTGNIYIWAPGLDWSDIEANGLIFSGVFEKQYHNRDTYRFALRELTESKWKTIPEQIITTDNWGNNIRTEGGAGSVAGTPQQILFGEWTKGIPLKCVDSANFYYQLMAGKSKGTEAEYNAGTHVVYEEDGDSIAAANYTFYPDATDREGNIVAYFDFTGDQAANEPLSCGGYGVYDGSGEITGTSGNLIEHPADIAYYLMKYHSLLSSEQIHKQSLKTVRSLLPGLKFATLINSQASGADIIDRIFRQCMVARISWHGKIGAMVFNFNAPSIKTINWERNIIGGLESYTKTAMDLVYNKIKVRYALNPTTGKYEEEFGRDRTNNTDLKRSHYDYGERPEYILDLPDVQEEATAIALANRLIDIRAERHDIVELELPYWDAIDLREGDVAELTLRDGSSLDAGGWNDERCILIERHFKRNSISTRWWRIDA